MSQPFSPNPGSVKHSLFAWFQQIGRLTKKVRLPDWNDPQTQPRLTQIQQTEGQALDLDTVMDQIVKLAWKELGALGTGVWLFTDNETFFAAGAGKASNDERLRLALLSRLLTLWQLSGDALTQVGKPGVPGDGPGSWLMKPLYQGHNVAGVLAAFSSRVDAFAELDSDKIRFLAEQLGQALTKAAAAGAAESIGLPPAQLPQLMESMILGLQKMVGAAGPWTDLIGEAEKTDSDIDRYPAVLSAEPSEGINHSGETVAATEPVDTTWLANDLAQPSSSDVSVMKDNHEVSAGVASQTPEGEAAESSYFPEVLPNRDRIAAFIKNCTSRVLSSAEVARAWLVNRGGSQLQLRLPALFRTAIVLALITIVFLALKTTRHVPTQVAESGSHTSAPEKKDQAVDASPTYREVSQSEHPTTVPMPQPQVAEQARASAPMEVSHLQVTDQSAKNALRSISHYEFVGLRRRALYGDDSAAFLMGMAYEIGHGVQQDCKTAAQWVANAAAQGNAVAQFNLGLRYRDGDGVPMNSEAAAKWLQKAASHQIPGAQLALTAVTTQQAHLVTSRP